MPSQIIAHGYIEIPNGSEEENAIILANLVEQCDPTNTDVASSIAKACSGWPSSIMPFARSFKKGDDQQGEVLVASFEKIIYALKALTARISLEDDEGLIDKSIVYTYGPRQFGGDDEWSQEEVS